MENKVFEWKLAGHPVYVSFLDPKTRYKLRPIPRRTEGKSCELMATPELIEQGRAFLPSDSTEAYIEYRCLISLSARLLLRYGCCVFHAAAFRWRDHAWLLTAPSGTGKTTQYLNWQRVFPGEIQMISGDMPILEARKDGSVWVHPSSWNGKEDLHGAPAAPLCGLVLLEQGQEDKILPLLPQDAVMPLLQQFMVLPETEEDCLALAALLDQILSSVPCCKMVNLGKDHSTILLREELAAMLEKEAEI